MSAGHADRVRPLIGLTGRRFRMELIKGGHPGYGHRLTDSFISDFAAAITRAGGVPVMLPYDADPAALGSWLSGVVITGGQDVHPRCWGGDESVVGEVDPVLDPSVHDVNRDEFEIALTRVALEREIPLLGVCRGMQVLNVTLGGTLIPDLPAGPVRHLMTTGPLSDGEPEHVVTFDAGTIAQKVFGDRLVTNSWHHQAIDTCGAGLVITGRTDDGVAESVELPGAPVLGVQWHPEWMITDDGALRWLVDAAAGRR
ncbi:gamma-glutamyl-gamma-aminobutyrate hydrolase family protein [Nocardia cyriacigeorgica]|uniref:gamma-glutamyl-gamma-aminobutyrate hydrolase family protein n=1 Tax=Nocardia cyriacigeorgica TaxID=135487 RepID=UPI001896327F|nr:gamma-glutamyl-gamma-aminobutyrate hydrolase family protein [Nocardia cyriacigeorgica]MBF6496695.1 gamma-glutamyl-gamma-aminobutyrate hydrolase family protein [Nocardia cyriacigeorgica]